MYNVLVSVVQRCNVFNQRVQRVQLVQRVQRVHKRLIKHFELRCTILVNVGAFVVQCF